MPRFKIMWQRHPVKMNKVKRMQKPTKQIYIRYNYLSFSLFSMLSQDIKIHNLYRWMNQFGEKKEISRKAELFYLICRETEKINSDVKAKCPPPQDIKWSAPNHLILTLGSI